MEACSCLSGITKASGNLYKLFYAYSYDWMADQNPRFRPRPQARRGGNKIVLAVEIIIALIIIYFVATYIIGATSVVAISGPTSLTVTNSTTLFTLSGAEYSTSLISAGSSSAQVSLTKLPVFLNPTFYVTLYNNSATKVNGTGTYANMQINLTSLSKHSIGVTITPVLTSLALSPDSSRITVADTSLTPFGSQASGSGSTTIKFGNQTSSTTAATTTIPSTNYYNQALNLLHVNLYYGLMENYTAVYANSTACTPSIYNQTFIRHNGIAPSGPSTYANVSQLVPYLMTLNVTNTTTTAEAVYSVQTKSSSFTGAVLIIAMNLQTKAITGTTLQGLYQGQNYSTLLAGYRQAINIGGGACGIWVG